MNWSGLKAAGCAKGTEHGQRVRAQAWRRAHGAATTPGGMRRARRVTMAVAALTLVPVAAAGTGTTVARAATIVVATTPAPAPTSGSVQKPVAPTLSPSTPAVNPGDWSTDGYACEHSSHGYTTWCNFVVGAEVKVGGKLTDRLIVRIKVNPGARVSKATYTAKYAPDSGRLSDYHIITYPLCYIQRKMCGNEEFDKVILGKNVTLYPRTPNMRGHQVGVAFSYGDYCASCTNKHLTVSYRTGMATCNKSNNNCYYPG